MRVASHWQPALGPSGFCTEAGRISRGTQRLGIILALGLLVSGCGSSGISGEVAAFKDSGHTTSVFADTEPSGFGAKKCQTGTVDRLSVLLCEYAASDTAAGGQAAAEAWGGETGTVVVQRRGSMLFAVSDRDHADREGKTISALSRVFRRTKRR